MSQIPTPTGGQLLPYTESLGRVATAGDLRDADAVPTMIVRPGWYSGSGEFVPLLATTTNEPLLFEIRGWTAKEIIDLSSIPETSRVFAAVRLGLVRPALSEEQIDLLHRQHPELIAQLFDTMASMNRFTAGALKELVKSLAGVEDVSEPSA